MKQPVRISRPPPLSEVLFDGGSIFWVLLFRNSSSLIHADSTDFYVPIIFDLAECFDGTVLTGDKIMKSTAKSEICYLMERIRKRISLSVDPDHYPFIKKAGLNAS